MGVGAFWQVWTGVEGSYSGSDFRVCWLHATVSILQHTSGLHMCSLCAFSPCQWAFFYGLPVQPGDSRFSSLRGLGVIFDGEHLPAAQSSQALPWL